MGFFTLFCLPLLQDWLNQRSLVALGEQKSKEQAGRAMVVLENELILRSLSLFFVVSDYEAVWR